VAASATLDSRNRVNRSLTEEVDARRQAFASEHRDCGGLRGVGWITGLYGFCVCGATCSIRFAEIRRMLNEEKEHWS
jgi:hypothetical protein